MKPSKICLFRRLIVNQRHTVNEGRRSICRFLLVRRVGGEWREGTSQAPTEENEMDATHHVKAWRLRLRDRQVELKNHHIHVLSVLKATGVFKVAQRGE